MEEFVTFNDTWPWPCTAPYGIWSCITHQPLSTHQISFKSEKLFVDGRTDHTVCMNGRTARQTSRLASLGRLGVDRKTTDNTVWHRAAQYKMCNNGLYQLVIKLSKSSLYKPAGSFGGSSLTTCFSCSNGFFHASYGNFPVASSILQNNT